MLLVFNEDNYYDSFEWIFIVCLGIWPIYMLYTICIHTFAQWYKFNSYIHKTALVNWLYTKLLEIYIIYSLVDVISNNYI